MKKKAFPYLSILLISMFLVASSVMGGGILDTGLGSGGSFMDTGLGSGGSFSDFGLGTGGNFFGGGLGSGGAFPDLGVGSGGSFPDTGLGSDDKNLQDLGDTSSEIDRVTGSGVTGSGTDAAHDGLEDSTKNLFNPEDRIPGFDNLDEFPDSGDYRDLVDDKSANWEDLENQHIQRGSEDGTIVYEDLKQLCTDADDSKPTFKVSKHDDYTLYYDGDDLSVKDLDPEYLGTETVEVSCNGVKADFRLTVTAGHGEPAFWKTLHDRAINKGSPDGTTVYQNIARQCIDNDDPEIIQIVSTHDNYDLYFGGTDDKDLKIKNLDPDYTGREVVELDCNGVVAHFNLYVVSSSTSIQDIDDESTVDMGVFIASIRIPDALQTIPGEDLMITLNLENSGDKKLKDVKIAATIPELAIRDGAGPLDISSSITKRLILPIPENAEPGQYMVRFTIHNTEVSRVVHREIEIQ